MEGFDAESNRTSDFYQYPTQKILLSELILNFKKIVLKKIICYLFIVGMFVSCSEDVLTLSYLGLL
jgi:hypothetical protein